MKRQKFAQNACAVLVAACGTLGAADAAHADLINIGGDTFASTEGLGNFSGSLNYEFNIGLNEWTLTVTLMNNSDPVNGGYITAFVFDIDSTDSVAAASLATSTHAAFANAPNQSAGPFGGPYTGGAGINGSFLGGGNPTQGIAVGEQGTFVFVINAADANSLTASSFLGEPGDYGFLVRFRGFEDGGSDMVPGVPGPAVLSAMAMFLIMPVRRRRA